MLFSGIPFLYYFLPVVLIVYYISPKAAKNTVLFFASLFFYAWGEPQSVLLMLASIVVGYVSGCLLEKYHNEKTGKYVLAIAVLFDIGLLVYFKYSDFLIGNFNRLTGFSVPFLQIALPIGISFYTFQIVSYKIDVYRGHVRAQKKFLNLALYIAMFPQLIAGPIVRYQVMEEQLDHRMHSVREFAAGVRRFVPGLAKKVLIANVLGELCSKFKESDEKSVGFFWLYAVAVTLQVYFDFSGYSDMAIGLGRMFGFHFPENFDYPYISRSITEFWRRWHMSLGSWFRDYVYIPLGGNRVSGGRFLWNVFVVWILTGLWHGAAWNFVIWGFLFAVLLIVEKRWIGNVVQKMKWLNHVYVMGIVILSFVLFHAENMQEAGIYIGGLFGIGAYPVISTECIYYLRSYAVVLVLAVIGVTPIPRKLVCRIKKKPLGEKIVNGLEPVVYLVFLLVVTAYLVDGSFNPFLYFRF